MNKTELIEKFQCPGCGCGSDTNCGSCKIKEDRGGFFCESHIAGTNMMTNGGLISLVLGLPKGFCRTELDSDGHNNTKPNIRIWAKGTHPKWSVFNVPVWAMEKDGFLFVRAYLPRINCTRVDIIEDGKFSELTPEAIDVSKFYEEMD